MGGQVDVKVGLDILLYSYSSTFHTDPYQARHTPIKFILKMLQIHTEVEILKSEEIKKLSKK